MQLSCNRVRRAYRHAPMRRTRSILLLALALLLTVAERVAAPALLALHAHPPHADCGCGHAHPDDHDAPAAPDDDHDDLPDLPAGAGHPGAGHPAGRPAGVVRRPCDVGRPCSRTCRHPRGASRPAATAGARTTHDLMTLPHGAAVRSPSSVRGAAAPSVRACALQVHHASAAPPHRAVGAGRPLPLHPAIGRRRRCCARRRAGHSADARSGRRPQRSATAPDRSLTRCAHRRRGLIGQGRGARTARRWRP